MANEPIQDNILGLFANQCANTFCKEKDGLDLWLTLYQGRNIEYTMIKFTTIKFTPFEVANICVMIGMAGFTLGFLIEKFIVEYKND